MTIRTGTRDSKSQGGEDVDVLRSPALDTTIVTASSFHTNIFDDESFLYVQLICHTRAEPTVFECTYDIFDQFHSQGPL